MELVELKEKLQNLPNIFSLVVDSDIVMNDKLDIYVKKRIDVYKKPRLLLSERLLLPCFPIKSYVNDMTHMAIESILAYHSEARTEASIARHRKEIEEEIVREQWLMIGILIASITPIRLTQLKHSFADYRLKHT